MKLLTVLTRTSTYGRRSFAVTGPSMWNLLPLSLHDYTLTSTMFRRRLKTELYHRAFTLSQHAHDCCDRKEHANIKFPEMKWTGNWLHGKLHKWCCYQATSTRRPMWTDMEPVDTANMPSSNFTSKIIQSQILRCQSTAYGYFPIEPQLSQSPYLSQFSRNLSISVSSVYNGPELPPLAPFPWGTRAPI